VFIYSSKIQKNINVSLVNCFCWKACNLSKCNLQLFKNFCANWNL